MWISVQNNMTLCARCFIRGNYRIGMSNTEFKRVEISEETKNEWTEKETLNLLEAITNFGDDWKRVAHQVVGRTDKECVARFLELPFGDQFLHSQHSESAPCIDDGSDQLKPPVDAECESETVASDKSSKRMCLTPLADASNPIMAQVLSWLKTIIVFFELLLLLITFVCYNVWGKKWNFIWLRVALKEHDTELNSNCSGIAVLILSGWLVMTVLWHGLLKLIILSPMLNEEWFLSSSCVLTIYLFKLLQAAFLSALAGTEVAQAAAQAALTSLSNVYKSTRINYRSFPRNTLQQGENDI